MHFKVPILKAAAILTNKIMGKHLDFYYECMATGRLKDTFGSGLCGNALYSYIDNELLNLFIPTLEDEKKLLDEGCSIGWWGYEVPLFESWGFESSVDEKLHSFTPLRQTIVLFMAAINGEL